MTNIVEAVDIGMPLRTVYDRWTEIEEFSSFTKGVTGVSRRDDVASGWKLKVAFSQRSWQATVQEQVPDDRMVWTSEGAKGTTHGAISFHELAPALTRVIAVVEYTPSGFFEKPATSGVRRDAACVWTSSTSSGTSPSPMTRKPRAGAARSVEERSSAATKKGSRTTRTKPEVPGKTENRKARRTTTTTHAKPRGILKRTRSPRTKRRSESPAGPRPVRWRG
ncbi:SRPBCC family protein [Streptomyces sp. NBC_01525]|uniref:SRPBCC family protein n=1 Tax=Streptomyces sp. NBC_01525 TaxID=2903893 RepID=UPI00386A4C5E